MTPVDHLAAAREAVLARVDRSDRAFRTAVLATAAAEVLLLGFSLSLMDFRNRDHLLMLALAVLTYTTIAVGLVALGAFVNRGLARILAGLELLRPDAKS
jgi:hypothetical protein